MPKQVPSPVHTPDGDTDRLFEPFDHLDTVGGVTYRGGGEGDDHTAPDLRFGTPQALDRGHRRRDPLAGNASRGADAQSQIEQGPPVHHGNEALAGVDLAHEQMKRAASEVPNSGPLRHRREAILPRAATSAIPGERALSRPSLGARVGFSGRIVISDGVRLQP
jgi:hypothetical protein